MATHEEEESGHSLKGPGEAQAARRRWYFSHHEEYRRLRDRHGGRAREHHERAARHRRETPRERNARAHHEHLAAQREYEEKRIEREESRRTWQELKRSVMEHGGIRSGTLGEDYAGVPRAVRTTNKHAPDIHDMASYHGYDSADEFIRLLSNTQGRASRAALEKPERPKRPVFEEEAGRLTLFKRHRSAELRAQAEEYRESRAMLREGEKELGKGHPALAELAEVVRMQRREYVDASRAAGERPAA